LNIIAQHEEIIDGTGFPQGLKESKIDPMALLVGSANRIDRMLTFERVKREELPLQLMMK
jgi:HD-GYP domain-containing protein (c-di-GMP phosphodiesterase class II)